jgi:ADP-heptose:LPS heptosyltransferase
MFRNGKYKRLEHLNIFYDNGGLGDHIAQMPTIKYMRDNCPNIVQHLWVPDYFLDLAKHLCPGVIIKSVSDAKKPGAVNMHIAGVKMSCPQHSNMAAHLVDVGFHLLANTQVDIKHKNYLTLNNNRIKIEKFNLPKEYIVLTVGFTAEVREMLPSVANEIIAYCKGRNLPVVMLGSQHARVGPHEKPIIGSFKEEINFSDTINLVNKTTLLEAGKIIAESKAIVGLDNGLLHLAGCSDVPIIAGFSSVLPEHRLPYRHNQLGWNCYTVLPDKDLECQGCQSRAIHVYDHDFRFCYYSDKLCIQQLTSNKYINWLDKVVK